VSVAKKKFAKCTQLILVLQMLINRKLLTTAELYNTASHVLYQGVWSQTKSQAHNFFGMARWHNFMGVIW